MVLQILNPLQCFFTLADPNIRYKNDQSMNFSNTKDYCKTSYPDPKQNIVISDYLCILKIPEPEYEADQSIDNPKDIRYNPAGRNIILPFLPAGCIYL